MAVTGLLVLILAAVGYLVVEQAKLFRAAKDTVTFASAPFPPLKFAAREDLDLHYVAVTESFSGVPIVVSFGKIERPFVLVLASRKAVTWQLENPPTRYLRSVLLATRDAATRLTGVPSGVAVYGMVPRRDLVVTHLAPVCLGIRCPGWSSKEGLPLQWVESALLEIAGRRIDTFATAEKTDAITVPGTPVTEEMRAAAEREAARLREEHEREQRLEYAEENFEAMFAGERQRELADLLTRHPKLDLGRLAEITGRVKIVSIRSGLSEGHDPHAAFLDYADFRANALRRIAPVEVRLATGVPTFLVLLSYDPVVWTILPEGRTTLTGVLVSSYYVSTIAGLPPEVPLDVLARENGDSTYYRNITEPGDETVLLEDLAAFSGIPLDIQTFERVSAIAAR